MTDREAQAKLLREMARDYRQMIDRRGYTNEPARSLFLAKAAALAAGADLLWPEQKG